MTDAKIWESICNLEASTGWPPSAVIDAVADNLQIDREAVERVYTSRVTMTGAG